MYRITSQRHSISAALLSSGKRSPSTEIDTKYGRFSVSLHTSNSGEECLTMSVRMVNAKDFLPTVRIHSACLFGESFYSLECECRAQLDAALKEIGQRGGILIYAFQEGRGAGLCAKIMAMELQRIQNISSVDAFRELGYHPDPRNYSVAIDTLISAGIGQRLRVITNNPHKLEAISAAGFEVIERVEPCLHLTEQRRTL